MGVGIKSVLASQLCVFQREKEMVREGETWEDRETIVCWATLRGLSALE